MIQNLKIVSVSLLACFLLFSTTGFGFYSHFCHSKQAFSLHFAQPEKCCSHQDAVQLSSCCAASGENSDSDQCALTIHADDCCEFDFHFVKLDEVFTNSAIVHLLQSPVHLIIGFYESVSVTYKSYFSPSDFLYLFLSDNSPPSGKELLLKIAVLLI